MQEDEVKFLMRQHIFRNCRKWDVLSGMAETAWDVLSGVVNLCGMFCPGCQKWLGMFCHEMFGHILKAKSNFTL